MLWLLEDLLGRIRFQEGPSWRCLFNDRDLKSKEDCKLEEISLLLRIPQWFLVAQSKWLSPLSSLPGHGGCSCVSSLSLDLIPSLLCCSHWPAWCPRICHSPASGPLYLFFPWIITSSSPSSLCSKCHWARSLLTAYLKLIPIVSHPSSSP